MNSTPNSTREQLLFGLALTKPAGERAAWLDRECGEDSALRARLRALLVAHEQPPGSLAAERLALDNANTFQEAELAREGAAEQNRPEGNSTLKLEFADSALDEAVGQTLGRYKLLEKVGEGGCGVVYVAEQTEPVRRRVALKVIKLGMDTKAVVARFEAERQALAMMDHPNIARVLDAGTTETGRPYFVMELVRGIKITDYCDQNRLPTKDRLDLFIKVCQAIQHAHQKGIIHRDIKPSNILVTMHDGVPVAKVIDFGIAKATEGRLTDATVYTQLHQFIGTPAYMSPEQAEMSGLDIDTRSDIYSLGVLLYELLTGKTPFDAKELMSLGLDAMRKTIREKEPVRPSTKLATLQGEELTTTAKRHALEIPRLIHQLRGDLDWIVMRCLEKDRTRRYETANGLAADIKRHLSHEPVLARPPSRAYRFQKAFRRNRVAFAASAAVLGALIVGVGISTWQMLRATRAEREQNQLRQVAVKALDGEKEERAQAETQRERADTQARKASESQEQSRRLLYASDMNLAQQAAKLNNIGKARRLLDRHRPKPAEQDLRGWEWRYLWQLTRSGALVTLTNQTVRGFSVSFSADGTRLAVGWFDGRVELWDVSGRRLIRTLTGGGYSHAGRVAFSHNGHLLVATSEPKTVSLYDFDTGRESVFWRAPVDGRWDVRDLSFSADDSRVVIYAAAIAFESNSSPRDEVCVVTVADASIQSRYPAANAEDNHFGAAQLAPDNERLYMARSNYRHYQYSIECLDLKTSQQIWQTEIQRDQGLTSLALSPDGRLLVSSSGYEDPTIRVWDPQTGRSLLRLDGHTSWICKLAFTRDGRRLISASADQSIRIWDTSNWTELQVLRGHADEVHAVAISETAHLIASASKDGDLMLWREDGKTAADGYRRIAAEAGRNELTTLDHSRVLLMRENGQRRTVLDLKSAVPAIPIPNLGSSSNLLWYFGNNVFCEWDGTNQLLIRDLQGDQFVQRGAVTLDSGISPIDCGFNARRQILAWSEGESRRIYLANLNEVGRRIELKSDVPRVEFLHFSKDGTYLAGLTSGGAALRAWNIETGQLVVSVNERVNDYLFAAEGKTLVVAVPRWNNHEIRFYDLAHPERTPRCIAGKHFASSLAISPDGLVASATGGGQVRLFDPIKGELIEAVHGHLNAIFGLDFSPDGRRLVSSSGGREAVKLWDVGTRQELLTLNGAGSTLSVARWTDDGDVILAGPPWQTWRAPSWEEINAAEANDPVDTEVRP